MPKIETTDDVFALVLVAAGLWAIVSWIGKEPLAAALIIGSVLACVGALIAWPLTIVFAIIGACVDGADGAGSGAMLAGIIGIVGSAALGLARLLRRHAGSL